jgi:hypothetical protein
VWEFGAMTGSGKSRLGGAGGRLHGPYPSGVPGCPAACVAPYVPCPLMVPPDAWHVSLLCLPGPVLLPCPALWGCCARAGGEREESGSGEERGRRVASGARSGGGAQREGGRKKRPEGPAPMSRQNRYNPPNNILRSNLPTRATRQPRATREPEPTSTTRSSLLGLRRPLPCCAFGPEPAGGRASGGGRNATPARQPLGAGAVNSHSQRHRRDRLDRPNLNTSVQRIIIHVG